MKPNNSKNSTFLDSDQTDFGFLFMHPVKVKRCKAKILTKEVQTLETTRNYQNNSSDIEQPKAQNFDLSYQKEKAQKARLQTIAGQEMQTQMKLTPTCSMPQLKQIRKRSNSSDIRVPTKIFYTLCKNKRPITVNQPQVQNAEPPSIQYCSDSDPKRARSVQVDRLKIIAAFFQKNIQTNSKNIKNQMETVFVKPVATIDNLKVPRSQSSTRHTTPQFSNSNGSEHHSSNSKTINNNHNTNNQQSDSKARIRVRPFFVPTQSKYNPQQKKISIPSVAVQNQIKSTNKKILFSRLKRKSLFNYEQRKESRNETHEVFQKMLLQIKQVPGRTVAEYI